VNPLETMALGELIGAARRSPGLTIVELSSHAGVGVRTLSDLERNQIVRWTVEAPAAAALKLTAAECEAIWTTARSAPTPMENPPS